MRRFKLLLLMFPALLGACTEKWSGLPEHVSVKCRGADQVLTCVGDDHRVYTCVNAGGDIHRDWRCAPAVPADSEAR